MYNKKQFKKLNDKKVLRKVRSRWVTVSVALLSVLGGAAVVHGNAQAAANPNHDSQANHQLSTDRPSSAATLIPDRANQTLTDHLHNQAPQSANHLTSAGQNASTPSNNDQSASSRTVDSNQVRPVSSNPFLGHQRSEQQNPGLVHQTVQPHLGNQVHAPQPLEIDYVDLNDQHLSFKPQLVKNVDLRRLTENTIKDFTNVDVKALDRDRQLVHQIFTVPNELSTGDKQYAGYHLAGIQSARIDKQHNQLTLQVSQQQQSSLRQILEQMAPITIDYDNDNAEDQQSLAYKPLKTTDLEKMLIHRDTGKLWSYLTPDSTYDYQGISMLDFVNNQPIVAINVQGNSSNPIQVYKRAVQNEVSAVQSESRAIASDAADKNVKLDASVATNVSDDAQLIGNASAALKSDLADLNNVSVRNASNAAQNAESALSDADQLLPVASNYVKSSASVSNSIKANASASASASAAASLSASVSASSAQRAFNLASVQVSSQTANVTKSAQSDQVRMSSAMAVASSAMAQVQLLRAANFDDQLDQDSSAVGVQMTSLQNDQSQIQTAQRQMSADLTSASTDLGHHRAASAIKDLATVTPAENTVSAALSQVGTIASTVTSYAKHAQQVASSGVNTQDQVTISYQDQNTHQTVGSQVVQNVDLNQFVHQAFTHVLNNDGSNLIQDDQYIHKLMSHVPSGYHPVGVQDAYYNGTRSKLTILVSRQNQLSLTAMADHLRPTVIQYHDVNPKAHLSLQPRSIPSADLKQLVLGSGTLGDELVPNNHYRFVKFDDAEVVNGQPIITLAVQNQKQPGPSPSSSDSSASNRAAIESDLDAIASYGSAISSDSANPSVQMDGDVAASMTADINAITSDESAASADLSDPNSAALINARSADQNASSAAQNASGLVTSASSYVQSSASASASRSASLSTSASVSNSISASQSQSASLSASLSTSTSASLSASESSSVSASTSASLSASTSASLSESASTASSLSASTSASLSASASASASASDSISASVSASISSASTTASLALSSASAAAQGLTSANQATSANVSNAIQDEGTLDSLAYQYTDRLPASQRTSLIARLSSYIDRIKRAGSSAATLDADVNGQLAAANSANAAGSYQQAESDVSQIDSDAVLLGQAAASGSSLTSKLNSAYNTALQDLNKVETRLVTVSVKKNGQPDGTQQILVNGKLGVKVPLSPSMFQDRSGFNKAVSGTVLIKLQGYQLSPGAAINYLSVPSQQSARLQVTYVDQSGHRFVRSFDGQRGQNGADVTKLTALPAGYHLNAGQSIAYQLNSATQSMTLGITGNQANDQQNAVRINVVTTDAAGHVLHRSVQVVHLHDRIGDLYHLQPNDYAPAGFHNQNNRVVNGTITDQGAQPSQVTFDYVKDSPSMPQSIQRQVQVPVYVNGIAAGAQGVQIKGLVGEVVPLNNSMIADRIGYRKSVTGTVTVGRDHDVVSGRIDYVTANPQPNPQPEPSPQPHHSAGSGNNSNGNSASNNIPNVPNVPNRPSVGPNRGRTSSGNGSASNGPDHSAGYQPGSSRPGSTNSNNPSASNHGRSADSNPGAGSSSNEPSGSNGNQINSLSNHSNGIDSSANSNSASDLSSGNGSSSASAGSSTASTGISSSPASANAPSGVSDSSNETSGSAGVSANNHGAAANGLSGMNNNSASPASDNGSDLSSSDNRTSNNSADNSELPQTGETDVARLGGLILALSAVLISLGVATDRHRKAN